MELQQTHKAHTWCFTLRNQFPGYVDIVLKTLMFINIVTCLSLNCMLYSKMKDLKDLVLNPQYSGDMKISESHLIVEYTTIVNNSLLNINSFAFPTHWVYLSTFIKKTGNI